MNLAKSIPLKDYRTAKLFNTFLDSHERNSLETKKNYARRIEEFFEVITDMSITFLSIEEVKAITHEDVQNYVTELIEKKENSHSTIITKLNSVKSFYDFLLRNQIQVNPTILKVNLKKNVKHSEAMTHNELELLYDFMKKETKLANEKYLLVKTMYTTASRVSVAVNLKWSDFRREHDIATGKSVWVLSVIGKGSKVIEKPIADDLYNELLQLKTEGQDKIFNVSSRTLERALERFSKVIGKTISPHCLKATSLTLAYQSTKDVKLVQQLGDHSSSSTTMDIYVKEEKEYTKQLSYNMSRELDDTKLRDMSKEDLLAFLDENPDIKYSILLRMMQGSEYSKLFKQKC